VSYPYSTQQILFVNLGNGKRAVKQVAPGWIMQTKLENRFAFCWWRWRMGWWETDGKREGGDVQ